MTTPVNVRLSDEETAFLDANWRSRSEGIRACLSLAIDAQSGPDPAVPVPMVYPMEIEDIEPEWRPGTVSVPRETTRKIKEHLNPVSPPTADYLAAKEAVRDTCDHGAWNGWNTLCPTCNRRMRD